MASSGSTARRGAPRDLALRWRYGAHRNRRPQSRRVQPPAFQGKQRSGPIVYNPTMEDTIRPGRQRRLARVLYNLVANASKSGDGTTCVELIDLGDSGRSGRRFRPWSALEERIVIFDRFSRGGAGGRRGSDSGVGLGLRWSRARPRTGRVWVEDRRDANTGAGRGRVPLDHMSTRQQLDRSAGGRHARQRCSFARETRLVVGRAACPAASEARIVTNPHPGTSVRSRPPREATSAHEAKVYSFAFRRQAKGIPPADDRHR